MGLLGYHQANIIEYNRNIMNATTAQRDAIVNQKIASTTGRGEPVARTPAKSEAGSRFVPSSKV